MSNDDSKNAVAGPFDAWCSQHKCPPGECFDIHNPQHAETQRLKRNAYSLCEHGEPVDTCIKCLHERMQIENYGSRGNGPETDRDDGTTDPDAAEVSGTREATTSSPGGQ